MDFLKPASFGSMLGICVLANGGKMLRDLLQNVYTCSFVRGMCTSCAETRTYV